MCSVAQGLKQDFCYSPEGMASNRNGRIPRPFFPPARRPYSISMKSPSMEGLFIFGEIPACVDIGRYCGGGALSSP